MRSYDRSLTSSGLLFILFLVQLLSATGATAQEASLQAPSQDSISFTAEVTSTIFFEDKSQSVSRGKIYASPPRIRYEPGPEEGGQSYNEFLLYEFEQRKMRRVFPDDRIYFEADITENNLLKAMKDGWIPWKDSPSIERRKIKLREDFVNDRPCILYLQERKAEISRPKNPPLVHKEYSLIWEATDLQNLPVRIVYFLPGRGTVIVDYHNVKLKNLDTPIFQPPEGFLNLSPF